MGGGEEWGSHGGVGRSTLGLMGPVGTDGSLPQRGCNP